MILMTSMPGAREALSTDEQRSVGEQHEKFTGDSMEDAMQWARRSRFIAGSNEVRPIVA